MKVATMGAAEESRAGTSGASFGRTLTTILVLALAWADPLPAAQESPSASPSAGSADRRTAVGPTGGPEAVFRMERLADGVWAAVVRERPPAHAFANSLVVIGSASVLIVDTQQSPVAARSLVERVRRLTDRPVRWIVNTHRHGDHHQGNVAWKEAYPGATVVSLAETRRWMVEEGPDELDDQRERVDRRLAETEAALETVGTGEVERARRLGRRAELLEQYAGVLETLELAPAELIVEEAAAIDLGGRTVRLLDLGAAHSEADLAVYLPEEGVVAAGDLLEAALPYVADSNPMGWFRALRRLGALEGETWLPGHGPVQHDRSLLDAHLRAFEAVAARLGSPEPKDGRDTGMGTVGGAAVDRCHAAWASPVESCRRWIAALERRGAVVASADSMAPREGSASADPGRMATPPGLLEADRAFLAATQADGAQGWASFFAEEGEMMLPGYHVRGRASILEAMRAAFSDPNYRITWTPERAALSDGGRAGFTTGRYRTTRSGTGDGLDRVAGRYVTFWTREDGGPWKVRVDIGLPDPERPE